MEPALEAVTSVTDFIAGHEKKLNRVCYFLFVHKEGLNEK